MGFSRQEYWSGVPLPSLSLKLHRPFITALFVGSSRSLKPLCLSTDYQMEKEMASHSSILAWRIPWTREPGGLLYMGSHRVGHDWSYLACMHASEKEMATHSSILAWRIPGTEEPGGLPSLGSHRVRHDWSDLAAAAQTIKICLLGYIEKIARTKMEMLSLKKNSRDEKQNKKL